MKDFGLKTWKLNWAIPSVCLISLFVFMQFSIGCSLVRSKQLTSPKVDLVTAFIDSIVNIMTLDEKIGQLTLFTSGWEVTGSTLNKDHFGELMAGRVGALFNSHTVKVNRKLQEIAVNKTRLGIPLLFGYDVIHGYKTIFPIPLAEACMWDLKMIEENARLSSKEAAAAGLNWTFNPMVDLARDPRWGRVAEGSGEDTYLSSLISSAKVKGIQGDNLGDPYTLMACVKHFAAYGASLAGRDYGTVDMSERLLREFYLPPYKAAVDAGAATVMTSFNELDGIPASGNKFLLAQILRQEWNFDGFVVSDYTSINEMINHGVAKNEKAAGELAFHAGLDMDMQGSVYMDHLKSSVLEGMVSESSVDIAVKRILTMKKRLGLFEDPFRYLDESRESRVVLSNEIKAQALKSAKQSIVLLKNEPFEGQPLLPLALTNKKIALIGPLVDNKTDLLGSWHAHGEGEHIKTLLETLSDQMPKADFSYSRGTGFYKEEQSEIDNAIKNAEMSDLVIMVLGENYLQSGEAASRTNINLPAHQLQLVQSVAKTGKPIILIVMAGRPLSLTWEHDNLPAILYAWQLGTMSAEAITDVLLGGTNPSGKITMTFPMNVGQIPIYYNDKNTGRPFDEAQKYTSKYLDSPNLPLYPFGYGLSYTTFEYGRMKLEKTQYKIEEQIPISIEIRNTGDMEGQEIVQLYIGDLVGSVTRPVKELKKFKKIKLKPGESKTIHFLITKEDLSFYDKDMKWTLEPGEFEIMIGPNSQETQKVKCTILNK